MKNLLFLFALLLSCTSKKDKLEQKGKMIADSARQDSINFANLKKQNDEKDKGVSSYKHYSLHELDSIFTGKKR